MRSYLHRLTRGSSEENDAITPCPKASVADITSPKAAVTKQHEQHLPTSLHDMRFTPVGIRMMSSRRGSAHSACSELSSQFDPTNGEKLDNQSLWMRMLDIQQKFHCYHSARMDAAIDALEEGEDVTAAIPSRICLDLLNDSIASLDPEARHQVQVYVESQ